MIEPTNPFLFQIKEVFKKQSSSNSELIFEILNLLIFQDSKNRDTVLLYKSLELKEFIKVCSLLDGRTIKLPTKQQIEDNLLTSLLYYEKEILHNDWPSIKKKYPQFEISSIKYSLQIKKLDEFILLRVADLFKHLSKEEKDKV